MGGSAVRALFIVVLAFALLAIVPPARAEPRPGPAPAFVPFAPNVRVNSGGSGYNHQVEPSMAINSAGRIFVGWKEAITATGGGQRVGFSYSTDGGATWAPNVLMPLAILAHQSDIWMTVTPSDRVFATRIEYQDTSSSGGISVSNTTDGVSWGTTWFYDDAPNFADKESAAHDAAGNLYWVWNTDSNTEELAFARSDDGGRTWTPKLLVNDQTATLGGIVQVAPSGAVYATWWNWNTNDIWFDRSIDGGRTWGTDIRVNRVQGTAWQTANWVIPLPAMVVAPDGTIYISWQDHATGNDDIVVARSTNGGTTWSDPVRVNDDAGTARQWMPDLAVDPWGGLHVAWEDDRTPGYHNIYYANSTNGGVTFGPNVLVSTMPTPSTYIRPGDYFAIEAASDGTVDVVWTDGRDADLNIYFASLPPDPRHLLDTVPPGLTLTIDGNPVTAPYRFSCPAGTPHTIGAPSPQVIGGSRYTYASWTDGGPQTHPISCSDSLRAYTAFFTAEHQVTVDTTPPGLSVAIDGFPLTAPRTYWWAAGSTHTLGTLSPQTQGTTRYAYLSWSDGGAQNHSVTVTAPRTVFASFATEYQVTVDTMPPTLNVTVDGVVGTAPRTYWWTQGSTHALDAPSPQGDASAQYTFTSWSDAGAQSHVVIASGPGTFTANFGTDYAVTVLTVPNGLEVRVDGTLFATPYVFWCGAGTTHTITATDPITPPESRITFQSWSDGGVQSHTILCSGPASYTATYLVEYLILLSSTPPGLELTADGSPSTGFWCVAGSVRAIGAMSPQGGPDTRYVFASWSDGGAPDHAIACSGARTLSATFGTEHRVTIDTSPPGLEIQVDGTTLTAPQAFWWPEGSSHPLDLTSPQGDSFVRHVFASWSDGGAQAHDMNATAPDSLVAQFGTQYHLGVATPRGTPACSVGDCWYDAGATATATVSPGTIDGGPGVRYVHGGWSGDASGGYPTVTVAMDGPRNVTADWRTEFLLTIVSPHGTPVGAGWYTAGTAAPVSIDAEVTENGTTYRFAGWTGGATGTDPSVTVTMDGPTTLTAAWGVVPPPAQGSPVLLWVGVLVLAVLILLAAFLVRRRRKDEDETPPPK